MNIITLLSILCMGIGVHSYHIPESFTIYGCLGNCGITLNPVGPYIIQDYTLSPSISTGSATYFCSSIDNDLALNFSFDNLYVNITSIGLCTCQTELCSIIKCNQHGQTTKYLISTNSIYYFNIDSTTTIATTTTTLSPTSNPTTVSPTSNPITISPTSNPTTISPTSNPTTRSPIQNTTTLISSLKTKTAGESSDTNDANNSPVIYVFAVTIFIVLLFVLIVFVKYKQNATKKISFDAQKQEYQEGNYPEPIEYLQPYTEINESNLDTNENEITYDFAHTTQQFYESPTPYQKYFRSNQTGAVVTNETYETYDPVYDNSITPEEQLTLGSPALYDNTGENQMILNDASNITFEETSSTN